MYYVIFILISAYIGHLDISFWVGAWPICFKIGIKPKMNGLSGFQVNYLGVYKHNEHYLGVHKLNEQIWVDG